MSLVRHRGRTKARRLGAGVASALVAIVGLVALPTHAAAQIDDVRVVMIASDESPDVGETFQIQIEARQSGSGVSGTLVPPAFGNLRVVGTTGQMRTQSMHQVFGSAPQIESRTVVGYMLVADSPGAYTISGATYRYGRRESTSDPLIIKVGGVSTTAMPPTTSNPASFGDAYDFDRDAFLRATVDRTDPYVGQQVTYTLYLYTRVDGEPSLTRQPTTNGFWAHDLLPPQRQLTPDFQRVRGVDFRVYVVQRVALFPERAGSLEIGGAELELDVGGIVGRMMGRSESIRRTCPTLRLVAKPLPTGAGPGTVVGVATISAEVDRSTVQTGEAVTLSITITGEGSLRDTNVPLPAIDGVRVETPTIDDRIESPRDLVGGTRTIRYQLVPTRPGSFEIPPMSITTLDVGSGALAHPSTNSFRITATGAAIDDPPIAAQDPDEPEDESSGDDAAVFGPMSPRSEMRRRALPIHARPYFVPLLVAPVAMVMALGIASAIRDSRLRNRAAGATGRKSKKPLADAKRAQSKGDAGGFYASISAALHDSLERFTGAKSIGMTHAELRIRLRELGADDELAERIVDELDGADFARFSASGASDDEMGRALSRTQALIDRLARAKPTEATP